MNLFNVYFRYDTPSRKFESISYDFKPLLDNSNPKESAKEIAELTKSSIQELENIISKTYKTFKKEETGEVTPYEIVQGYTYTEKKGIFSKLNPVTAWLNNIKLELKLKLNYNGIPSGIDITFRNSDKRNILSVHDIIISNPELMITESAEKQLQNIEYLRNHKFEPSKYLLLK
jgi:hypothetical protein